MQTIEKISDRVTRHNLFTHIAAIAYATALSLAPFILILLSLAALLSWDVQEQLLSQIDSLLGPSASLTVRTVVENAKNRPSLSSLSGLIAVVVLAFSASFIFSSLRAALDQVYKNESGCQPRPEQNIWSDIKERLFNMGLVFSFIFVSVVSLAVTAALNSFFTVGTEFVWRLLFTLFNILVFTLLFTGIHYYIPTRRPPFKLALRIGFLNSIAFQVGKFLIGIYLGRAAIGSAYGAGGSLIVFLVWVYYTAAIILLSTEVILYLYNRRGVSFHVQQA